MKAGIIIKNQGRELGESIEYALKGEYSLTELYREGQRIRDFLAGHFARNWENDKQYWFVLNSLNRISELHDSKTADYFFENPSDLVMFAERLLGRQLGVSVNYSSPLKIK